MINCKLVIPTQALDLAGVPIWELCDYWFALNLFTLTPSLSEGITDGSPSSLYEFSAAIIADYRTTPSRFLLGLVLS